MIRIPKGTKDILPGEGAKWRALEQRLRAAADLFGYKEVRTPMFEHTELFQRGVGEGTDIVGKEMYTMQDLGGRSITLKPEGTAGVARMYIESGLGGGALPVKMFYITPCFRYERPQAGRYRQFHQFGVELFGSPAAEADAETIALCVHIFGSLGVSGVELNINNIGCNSCRKNYNAALKKYFEKRIGKMCGVCAERLNKNPLRILDCKDEKCAVITSKSPKTLDFLCSDCTAHRKRLTELLTAAKIEFVENPNIVRGLDYYTGTVFEFIADKTLAMGTVLGGGRYNGLVKELGGADTPAVGFAVGLERLMALMQNGQEEAGPDIYIAPVDEAGRLKSLAAATELRRKGISVEVDLMGRSLKAQMKYAGKIAAQNVLFLGEEEIKLKNMANGQEKMVQSLEEIKPEA